MAAAADRLRAVPRARTAVAGVTTVGVVVLVSILVAADGDGTLSTADPGGSVPIVGNSSAGVDSSRPVGTTDTAASLPRSTSAGTTTATRPPAVTVDVGYDLVVDAEVPAVAGRTLPDEPDRARAVGTAVRYDPLIPRGAIR